RLIVDLLRLRYGCINVMSFPCALKQRDLLGRVAIESHPGLMSQCYVRCKIPRRCPTSFGKGAHGKGLLVSTSPGAYPIVWGQIRPYQASLERDFFERDVQTCAC